jgi:hypothetical protein
MADDAPTTLDDYRVRAGDGRVILFLASRPDERWSDLARSKRG